MILSRQEVIDQIASVWREEVGGDIVFRTAYDAMWTTGGGNWTPDIFFQRFQMMQQMLPRLHPNDLVALWNATCKSGKKISVLHGDEKYFHTEDAQPQVRGPEVKPPAPGRIP